MRAEPAAVTEATAATGPLVKGPRWLLPAGALLLAAALAAYLADLVTHLSYMAAMRDLVVYRNGGLIVRHVGPGGFGVAQQDQVVGLVRRLHQCSSGRG